MSRFALPFLGVRMLSTPDVVSSQGVPSGAAPRTLAEVVQRVVAAAAGAWNGAIPLIPAFPTAPGTDLFR